MSWVSILVALAGGIVPGQIIMTKRPETLTVSLSRADHAAQREALNDLAEALGLRGISGLVRWLADTYTGAAASSLSAVRWGSWLILSRLIVRVSGRLAMII